MSQQKVTHKFVVLMRVLGVVLSDVYIWVMLIDLHHGFNNGLFCTETLADS